MQQYEIIMEEKKTDTEQKYENSEVSRQTKK